MGSHRFSTSDTYPNWIYDGSDIPDPFGYGERAVQFLRALRHPKSRLPGGAFDLTPWQERIVRRIYGPCHENGRRIVRNVAMLLPRGNRKTSLGAALGLLHTMGPEAVPGGEAIFAASDRKQARIAYDESIGIVRAIPHVEKRLRLIDSKNRLTVSKTAAFLEAISADAGTQHGRTPLFALVDELHAWKKRDLWDVVRTGLTKVPGSLLMVISTAGRGQENVAYDFYDYARKVARGEVDDPGTLPILFETPREADWTDENVWYAANPGLEDGFPDIEGLRQMAREAKERPGEREAFRQLHLNVWLDHSSDPFVDMLVYDQGAFPVEIDDLEEYPCWLGVDLSSNNDLTAIVAAWQQSDGYIVHPWFFCPEDNLRGRADRDGVPYPEWSEAGHITATPGNVVDYRVVEDQIRELCARFNVQEVAFDPHMARNIMNNLQEDGFPAVEMRQGWVTMAPAVKELERAILGRRLIHGGHPVLRWNFENIVVHVDAAGNKAFHKGKSKDRIDGAVACAMAVGRAAAGESTMSIYDSDTFEEEMGWF
ncbi:terminase large subunit [Martelella lutilitoris]|uniref:Terminase large subunit n=1 Tax=Martelella lutilitoris TaxID=2583532 RepID=A0A5C4JPH0_9HYPH|nr:terminase TerL endonuclease subunit [Martelella lutilitoris]TNB46529.1 terminase large subunit [Martelella lutilitoris]